MNWKTKALIQNAVDKLPSSLSYPAYYLLQRYFGGLRRPNPVSRLVAAKKMVDLIAGRGQSIQGKVFVEVGTGRRVNVPIGVWLCGAAETITVDQNPYLKIELVYDDIAYMDKHQAEVWRIFGAYAETDQFRERFGQLVATQRSRGDVLKVLGIRFQAPGDARDLGLPKNSVDYHISYAVFEHIPGQVIHDILVEGRRILKPDGLFVHWIDFTDHFEQRDKTISRINFLQFSDKEWDGYAGNRFMYQNRLRVDDYQNIFGQTGCEVLDVEPTVDAAALALLNNGFQVHERFRGKSHEVNATANAWIVASPSGYPAPAQALQSVVYNDQVSA